MALAEWLKEHHSALEVRVKAQGVVSQVVSLLRVAEIRIEKRMKSLSDVLTKPVRYSEAPKLVCVGLFPEFDLERLFAVAEPVRVE